MNYNDITIEQYQKLSNCILLQTETIEGSEIVNAYELGMDILEIFEGVPRSESSLWSVKDFDSRLAKYKFLNEPIQSDSWVVKLQVDGKEYKVKQTPDKWNVGQYVSMANLTKRQEDIVDNCHIIIAVMLNETSDTSELMEFAEKVRKEVTIDKAYPLAVFFTAVMLMLPPNIAAYSQVEESQIGSGLNGGGTTHS